LRIFTSPEPSSCRPGEGRDPYRADSRFGNEANVFCDHQSQGLMGPGLRRDDRQTSRLLQ
jgi:hypothetical protein